MLTIERGGPELEITPQQTRQLLESMLGKISKDWKRVLLLPPDYTRAHSGAGEIATMLYSMLSGRARVLMLPALGTHRPMSADELDAMFPGVPHDSFIEHDWRNGLVRLGEVPSSLIHEWSEGKLDYSIDVEVNKLLPQGGFDAIISIGQVVPHEVAGMANGNKNVLVGTGGQSTINKSHFLGAVFGMERMMGHADTPVRFAFDYAEQQCLANLPLHYIQTVRDKNDAGEMVTRGLYAGEGTEPFAKAAALSQKVNLDLLDEPLRKVIVYLDPGEFKSTWLGNKAVYRTRMAMADDGELIILAPGLLEFGEDGEIDRLIRRFGYRGTPATLAATAANPELENNLSAAAHLIHGSSEGRFKITYAPGKNVSQKEIESVGFLYDDLNSLLGRYAPDKMVDGMNTMPDGEEVFYISNPALGLWGLKSQFA
jgi:nickel-dependent lactate racemase